MDKIKYCKRCRCETIWTISGSGNKGTCSECGYSFDKDNYYDLCKEYNKEKKLFNSIKEI